MLRNYLKIAWRNLKRNKSYTVINLIGLAVGIACCILIALYIQNEYSIDQFHKHANRIYAIIQASPHFGKGISTPYPLAPAIQSEIPEVQKTVRLTYVLPALVTSGDKKINEKSALLYADSTFFQTFTFPLAQGNAQKALQAPNSIVLTPDMATKYFGKKNAIGQTIKMESYGEAHEFTITGILKNDPKNTILNFKFIASLSTVGAMGNDPDSWNASNYRTFVLLNSAAKPAGLGKELTEMKNKYVGKKSKVSFSLKALPELYLSDLVHIQGFKGDVRYHYIFGAIALFILLIACFNYMNLTTAQSLRRRREVGVRKTAGAHRGQIMRQFFTEAIMLSIAAFVVALFFVEISLPAFNSLVDKQLQFHYARHIPFLLSALGFVILIGAISGSYPAVILSRFSPASVFRETTHLLSSSRIRKGLIVVQFMVATVLIIGTIVIYKQLYFVQHQDLGFDKKNVVMFSIQDDSLRRKTDVLKHQFLQYPEVKNIAASSGIPGQFYFTFQMPVPHSKKRINPKLVSIDEDYLKTLGIKLIAGRNYSAQRPSDETGAYILNESAAKALGWTAGEAIGKPLKVQTEGKVIGVVKDFHYTSLHQKIGPVIFRMKAPYDDRYPSYGMFVAKINGGNIQQRLTQMRKIWQQFDPNHPFEYVFLDNIFRKMYRSDHKLSQLFSIFALLGIFIAALGLLGLSAYTAERRTKEIGVRKVLGATVTNIVSLLSKDFLKLVMISFIIAVPIAWYAMHQWLQDFAYKINIGPWIFLLAGALALFIALATVSWQSIRAALANPVDSLRSE